MPEKDRKMMRCTVHVLMLLKSAKVKHVSITKKNKERIAVSAYARYQKNSSELKERCRGDYSRNKITRSAKKAEWKGKNLERLRVYGASRRASKLNATPAWANTFFIDKAYALARLREEIYGVKWHVDHIIPLKNKIVCGLHVHNNLQVIPASENCKKYNSYCTGIL